VLHVEVHRLADQKAWDSIVLRNPLTTADHLYMTSPEHFIVKVSGHYQYALLLPAESVSIAGRKALVSFGNRRSGGPLPLRVEVSDKEISEISEAVMLAVDNFFKKGYAIVNFTVKTYINELFNKLLLAILTSGKNKEKIKPFINILNARVLYMNDLDYKNLWSKVYNKKVRNAIRKFERERGKVEHVKDPLNYFEEIMRINLSTPLRQGTPLPQHYTDPQTVFSTLKKYHEAYGRDGIFRVYRAYTQENKTIGYAYVLKKGGHVYISRFLIDIKYSSINPGEGLLNGILEDLLRERDIKVVQYGYWSPKAHPGIDHFLKQFGFTIGQEVALWFFKNDLDFKLLSTYLRLKQAYVPLRHVIKRLASESVPLFKWV
jgi:hypothetical protein